MGAFITGLIFLLAGAGVYAYNTESHAAKITFNRFGVHFNEVETVAILLGLGVFFLGVGAFRWLGRMKDEDDSEEL